MRLFLSFSVIVVMLVSDGVSGNEKYGKMQPKAR